MGFRENLKEELAYQDMKVKELAEKTGISKHTLDHYLTINGSQPQVELAVKIAQALNVSVEYLVLGKKEIQTKPSEWDTSALTEKIKLLSHSDFKFVKKLVNLLT